MNRILIDMVTGTVLNYDDKVVIVDVDELGEHGNTLMDEWNVTGSDDTIMQVGKFYGKPVVSHFQRELSACIAYTPDAIREEAGEMLGNGLEGDHLTWAHEQATDEQLYDVASYILNSDTTWTDYVSNIVEGITWGQEEYGDHLPACGCEDCS